MPSRLARVPGTRAVVATPGGPVRIQHSAAKPVCPQCGTPDHVVRLWHGSRKVWICDACYDVTSTKTKEPTLKERILHRLPEPETLHVSEILVNRAARRRRR